MTKAQLQKENEKLQARIRVLEGAQRQSDSRIRALSAEAAKYLNRTDALEWALVLAHRQSNDQPWGVRPGDSLSLAT